MKHRLVDRVIATAALLAVLGVGAYAQSQPAKAKDSGLTLGDANVVNLEGQAANLNEVAPQGNWLLIVLRNASPATQNLLQNINRNESAELAGRIVVVGAGMSVAQLKELKAKYPDFPDAAWYSDPQFATLKQLHYSLSPTIAGMRDRKSNWEMAGVLLSTERVRTTARSWIEVEAVMDRMAKAPAAMMEQRK